MKRTILKHLSLWLALSASAFVAPIAPSHATTIAYFANLSGPAESPPNASPGTGTATVTVDTIAQTMRVQVTFSDLLGTTTASHIHCCTPSPDAGTALVATTTPTFLDFPLGVTSGTYDHTLDLTLASSYNPAFVTTFGGVPSAENALLAGLAGGLAYLNIHTTVVPGGEIRGFLAVPGPIVGAGLPGLMAVCVGLIAVARRRRERGRA
jgi:hypothetical protein